MSNNKQNSIDWLVSELTNLGYIFAPSFGHKIISDKIKQAKAKHQEEVEDFTFEWQRQKTMTINEFYNKTFGGEK